jgi:hypothetical protein
MGWKDLSAGLLDDCLATFGETVAYTPVGGALLSIQAVFDADHVVADAQSGEAVTSVKPAIFLRRADLPAAPKRGDQVVVQGQTYKVIDWQPDSEGGGIAVLHKA